MNIVFVVQNEMLFTFRFGWYWRLQIRAQQSHIIVCVSVFIWSMSYYYYYYKICETKWWENINNQHRKLCTWFVICRNSGLWIVNWRKDEYQHNFVVCIRRNITGDLVVSTINYMIYLFRLPFTSTRFQAETEQGPGHHNAEWRPNGWCSIDPWLWLG